MARIKTTAIVADIRNSINGTVFSKNRYGAYARTKVTPVNPQTSFQQDARQLLGNLSASWRGLTQEQRDAWIAAAPNFPQTDIFGDSQILSGQVLFVRLNQNLANMGFAAITSPPTPAAIPVLSISDLLADSATPEISFNINTATVPAGFRLQVYATPSIPAGRSFVKNRYRYLGTFTATTNAVDITTAWIARFGELVPGQKLFVSARLTSADTGEQGVAVSSYAIITS